MELFLLFKKAQATSTEFLFMLTILIALIVFSIGLWNLTVLRIRESETRTRLETLAFEISDQLIKSQGLPTSWEDDTSKIFYLGLAKENYILDTKKVNAFSTINYQQTKDLLGISSYDYKFRIKALNGTVLAESGKDASTASEIVFTSRTVLYQGEVVRMEFGLWV